MILSIQAADPHFVLKDQSQWLWNWKKNKIYNNMNCLKVVFRFRNFGWCTYSIPVQSSGAPGFGPLSVHALIIASTSGFMRPEGSARAASSFTRNGSPNTDTFRTVVVVITAIYLIYFYFKERVNFYGWKNCFASLSTHVSLVNWRTFLPMPDNCVVRD